MTDIRTLRELRASGHEYRAVRDELRSNLIERLRSQQKLFPGIVGYDDTVIPQIVNALLSRHHFILLGLRGQAKTRLLRALGSLLDERTPVIPECPLNSHPYRPLSHLARNRVDEMGDDLEIGWLGREERYREKLATPDITIADLIGDIDPIKAATRKLDLAHEEVIHYGIIPRTNRGIFGINELPDLPTRIQVGLLNILEESDIQIRGFPMRLPMDLLLVFTANPEDYTNRGNIITPLRDRIESQIHTHYPLTLEEGMRITAQEAWTERQDGPAVELPTLIREVIEESAVQARNSPFVDQNSGVSARMTIALLENVLSNAERRALRLGSDRASIRIADLLAAASGVTGKIELVYEGEREGPEAVARTILGKALKAVFDRRLPDPYDDKKGAAAYSAITEWFKKGNQIEVSDSSPDEEHVAELARVPGLEKLARKHLGEAQDGPTATGMEFILEGLHQAALLAKEQDLEGARYGDAFDAMVSGLEGE